MTDRNHRRGGSIKKRLSANGHLSLILAHSRTCTACQHETLNENVSIDRFDHLAVSVSFIKRGGKCPIHLRLGTKLYINPAEAAIHAANARKMNTCGMIIRGSKFMAFDNWKVQVVYIPSGKTIPQYCGS